MSKIYLIFIILHTKSLEALNFLHIKLTIFPPNLKLKYKSVILQIIWMYVYKSIFQNKNILKIDLLILWQMYIIHLELWQSFGFITMGKPSPRPQCCPPTRFLHQKVLDFFVILVNKNHFIFNDFFINEFFILSGWWNCWKIFML